MNDDIELLTTEQAAKILNISSRTLRRLYVKGTGPKCVNISTTSYRYTRTALVDWVASGGVASGISINTHGAIQ